MILVRRINWLSKLLRKNVRQLKKLKLKKLKQRFQKNGVINCSLRLKKQKMRQIKNVLPKLMS